MDMHAGQLTVSAATSGERSDGGMTVRALVDEQFPQFRALPISAVNSHGTVNAIFRIGDRFAARFPLEAEEGADVVRDQLLAEAEAARQLAGRTRFRTPEPVVLGEPGLGYPLPWSVQTWLHGTVATEQDPGESTTFASDLAEFISGVRAIDTRGRTFTGRGRGGDLQTHDDWIRTCLERSRSLLDVAVLQRMWESLRELPRGGGADVMTHGDLLPGNLLVSGSHLAGVLDVGGLAPADPALDLVCAWHLLEAGPRRVLRVRLRCDDLEWERGRAWAFQQAMGLVWYYVDSNPVMSQIGRRTLARLAADVH
jgi:aminoglycoside phosphotransferase (APT) family kinase protein